MPKHIFVAQLLPCYGHIVFHSPFAQDHPMHLHGHDFWVLGFGYGEFHSSNPNSLTLVDAPRRDVAMMPASGSIRYFFCLVLRTFGALHRCRRWLGPKVCRLSVDSLLIAYQHRVNYGIVTSSCLKDIRNFDTL